MRNFEEKLQNLKQQNRLRTLNPPHGIDLSSNDYLGMRSHPALRAAAIEALQNGIDLGAGGSRLLRGHTEHHENLEHFAAQYFASEKALYFANGYQANQAIFQALPARHDMIIFDEFIHASAREAIQHSPAQHIKARHNDLQSYEDALKQAQQNRKPDAQIWIAVESLYSMDGDFAPLSDLYKLAQKFDAMLIVDEAHATGVWGKDGKGFSHDLPQQNLITLHTCGKAIGVAGGLVCASADIIDTLINTARPFIYSTAPPPLQALLVQKSLEILAASDAQDNDRNNGQDNLRDKDQNNGHNRRAALHEILHYVKLNISSEGPFKAAESQIIPIILGSDEAALNAAQHLQQAGFDIRAIRPPTVPEGTARLRLSLSVGISQKILDDFAERFIAICKKQEAA